MKIILAYLGGFAMCLLATLSLNTCDKKGEMLHDTIHTEKIFIYDSTQKNIPVPQTPASVSVKTVAVPAGINYDSIAKYFFAIATYSQQIQDSSLRAVIFDTISQNRIVGRSFKYSWLKPKQTITSTTITLQAEPKLNLFAGGFFDYTKNKSDFGPSISLKTKKDVLFSYDYALLNGGNRIKVQTVLKFNK